MAHNHFIGQSKQPSHPLPGIPHISDTKIRFEHGVYFNPVESMYGNTSRDTLQDYLKQNYPERLDGINIHIPCNPNLKGGNANSPAFNDNIHLSILMINNNSDPKNDPIVTWGFSLVVAHVLGHSLDLLHTYYWNVNFTNPRPEFVAPNHPDFLWDALELEGVMVMC